jgi:prephenate dehydrogenase
MIPLKRITVAILGLGQIGGSIGRDLVAGRFVREIIGFDREAKTLRQAQRLRAVTRTTSSLKIAVAQADLIVIALPIQTTLRLLPAIVKLAGHDKCLLDVTSTKQVVFERLHQLAGHFNYISGHPLAGNEGVGIKASTAGMFKGKPFALLPHDACAPVWIRKVMTLVRKLGARSFTIDPERHDQLTSLSIQTPYFLAYLLSRMAVHQTRSDKAFWNLAGGSINGAVRVMKSSPELTLDLLLTNRDNVLTRIDELASEMKQLRQLLTTDPAQLAREIKATRRALIKQTD